MKIRHVHPPLTYVVLIAFTNAMWRSHKQDAVIYEFESTIDETEGWNYEDYTGPASDIVSDYALAFDTRAERTKFIKKVTKEIGKHIKMVTTMDVTG